MKILIKRMSLIIVVLIIAISVIIFYGYHSEIDFTDNPGLLEKIDENGTVYLDTYQGKVVGTLNKVKWKKEKVFLKKRKKLYQKRSEAKSLI